MLSDVVGYCQVWWDVIRRGGILTDIAGCQMWWDIVRYGGILLDTVGWCDTW